MKMIRLEFYSALAMTLTLMASLRCEAAPLSPAFTYEGRLMDGGAPANGLYDFKLTLFDALTLGAPVGSPSTVLLTAVPVANGVFTATLDFGSAGFDGSDRWLQINVKANGAELYTSLSPRQPLTPTPYALYADRTGIANAVADRAISRSSLALEAVEAANIGAGQVVKSVNGLAGAARATLAPSLALTS
jgi:hypothetical protein